MDVVKWAEDNPIPTAGIVIVGGLGLLWLLGFFGSSSSSSSSSSGASNLAAAYYAAEAAQTTAGTNLQIATVQATAATQGLQIQANAATAINRSNNTAATIINGQNTDLGATQANDTLATAQSANEYAYLGTVSNNAANENIAAMQTIIPAEINQFGNLGFVSNLPGGGTYSQSIMPNPAAYVAEGYTPQQAAQLLGVA